jgi:hypothetical protein
MPGSSGGSFLGTAAATAAGVVGGALLMNSIRGMFGGSHGQSQSAFDSSGGSSPWGGGGNLSNTDLARDAGVDDISRGGNRMAAYDDQNSDRQGDRQGFVDTAQNDNDDDDGDYDDGGDTDTA